MHKQKTLSIIVLGALLIAGCARNAILKEISGEQADDFRSNISFASNAGLYTAKHSGKILTTIDSPSLLYLELESTKGPAPNTVDKTKSNNTTTATATPLWIQVHVAVGILAEDESVEKFEEGSIKGHTASGEIFEGNFLGYRPRGKEHCTRSWIMNLYYFDSRGRYFSFDGGVAVLKGNNGTELLCAYGWIGPNCEREGICEEIRKDKYYKLKF